LEAKNAENGLADALDFDAGEVVGAEFEQGGVLVNLDVIGGRAHARGAALPIEFLERERVERDGVLAEAQFIEHDRVVEQALVFALVLANERIDNVQDDFVPEGLEGVNFRDGGGHVPGIGFKADGIVHAAHGEAVEVSANTGGVVVQERRELDDLRKAPRDELGDIRFAAGAFVFAAELEIAIEEVADERRFVVIGGIPADVRGAFDGNAIAGTEFKKTRAAEITAMLVPNDDVAGVKARSHQAFNDCSDERRTRAAMAAQGAIDLQADDILCRRELTPRSGGICGQKQFADALVDHLANGFGARLEGLGGVCVFDDDNAIGQAACGRSVRYTCARGRDRYEREAEQRDSSAAHGTKARKKFGVS